MKNALLALLVACGDNYSIKPDASPDANVTDAAPDAVPVPVGAHTWQWAWDYFVVAWCVQYDACSPIDFTAIYGTPSECVAANSGFCDVAFGHAQCEAEYPPEREPLIMRCVLDWAALACDAYPETASCDAAFAR